VGGVLLKAGPSAFALGGAPVFPVGEPLAPEVNAGAMPPDEEPPGVEVKGGAMPSGVGDGVPPAGPEEFDGPGKAGKPPTLGGVGPPGFEPEVNGGPTCPISTFAGTSPLGMLCATSGGTGGGGFRFSDTYTPQAAAARTAIKNRLFSEFMIVLLDGSC
jgi:hypothetical protein